MRSAAIAVFAAASLALVAACGGGSGPASSGGATLAPGSTALFVAINTDSGSDQWRAAQDLLERFPEGPGVITDFLAGLEREDLDYETDVEPALGSETDLVLLDLTDDPAVVVLTQPDDPAKFRELVESGDEPGVVTELDDGWWAAAETQTALDELATAREAGDPLGDSGAFDDAMGELPDDALVTVYVGPSALDEAASASQSGDVPLDQRAFTECLGGQDTDGATLAVALSAEDGGVRVNGAGTSAIPVGESGDSSLDEFFPGDALAYVSGHGFGDAFQASLDCVKDSSPELNQGLAQVQLALGTSVEDLLGTLFGGELGVAVYGPGALGAEGGVDPIVIMATEVEDEGEALATVTGLFDRLAAFGGEELVLGDATVEGMEAKSVISEGATVAYFGTLDGKLVASNSEAGLSALSGDSSLADDAAFASARDAAGLPDEAASVIYVNLQAGLGLAGAAFSSAQSAPGVLENVEPLKSLLFWSDAPDDGTASFEAFLQID